MEPFKQLWKRYERGETTPEESAGVEEELLKYRLLTEYMSEHDDLPPPVEAGTVDGRELRRVHRAVRRGRLLVLVAAAVLACVLLAICRPIYQGAILPLLNQVLFLDPSSTKTFGDIGELDVAVSVFDSLLHPGCTSLYSGAETTGLWKYDLYIYRWVNGGRQTVLRGMLDKGKIELWDEFQILGPAVNGFTRGSYPFHEAWEGMEPDRVAQEVGELPPYVEIRLEISFRRDLTMEEIANLNGQYPGLDIYWIGVRNGSEQQQTLPLVGFCPSGLSFLADSVEARYPYMMLEEHKNEAQPMILAEHFKALLSFTADHGGLMDALGDTVTATGRWNFFGDYAGQVLEYVEQNGVKTYGIYVTGRAKELAALCKLDFVEQVSVVDLKLSI